MFESLSELVSGSPWTYAFLFAISALDAIVPLVPSETSVIAAGVIAGSGRLDVAVVALVAAAGAGFGDNCSYWIGRLAGERLVGRLLGSRAERRLDWARRLLAERGAYLIVVSRFIPGGRTVTTLTAGLVRYRWTKFVLFDLVAALTWGMYAAFLGYFGGKAFEEDPFKGLLLALGLALAITALVEGIRWLRRHGEQASA